MTAVLSAVLTWKWRLPFKPGGFLLVLLLLRGLGGGFLGFFLLLVPFLVFLLLGLPLLGLFVLSGGVLEVRVFGICSRLLSGCG